MSITTKVATNIKNTYCTGNGNIIGYSINKRGFEYGLTETATWRVGEPGVFEEDGDFSLQISGLTPETKYYYRAFAEFTSDSDFIQRTTTSTDKKHIQLQVVGNKIYYVWDEDGDIWTAIMDLDGSNWSATQRTSLGTDLHPQLQVVGDKIYYVWQGGSLTSPREIWTAIMDIDGSNWVATKRETNTVDTWYPQLQVSESTIYYVWVEVENGYRQIWTATMGIDGSNWTATRRTDDEIHKNYPQLQVVGSKIYYVFKSGSNNISTAVMDTDGSNWSHTQRTDFVFNWQSAGIPQLQVVGNKIYYVFIAVPVDDPPSKIYTATMGIDGSGWTETQRTTFTDPLGHVNDCQFQVYGNKIYYIFEDGDFADNPLYTAVTDISGNGWTQKKIRSGVDPQLQVVNDVIYYVLIGHIDEYDQIWTSGSSIGFRCGDWVSFTTKASASYGIYEETNLPTICFYIRQIGGKWSIKHGPYTTDQADIEITKILTEGKGKYQIKIESNVLTGISTSVMVKLDIKART